MPVRDAEVADVDEIAALVHEHAAFEGAAARCRLSPDHVRAHLFGPGAFVRSMIAYPGTDPQEVAGFALWFPTFSSWEGSAGNWLEDLFVRPAFRRFGLGRELLVELHARTPGRLDWDVLDTNESAPAFYGELGAVPMGGSRRFRLTHRDLSVS